MARIFYPDVCPSGKCVIALAEGADDHQDNVPVALCQHHQNVKNRFSLDDAGIMRAIFQSSRVREAARWAVKVELGLDKNHPGIPYRTNADGSFTLLASPSDLAWRREDGSDGPLPTIVFADRERAADKAEEATALVDSPPGTSTVRRLT